MPLCLVGCAVPFFPPAIFVAHICRSEAPLEESTNTYAIKESINSTHRGTCSILNPQVLPIINVYHLGFGCISDSVKATRYMVDTLEILVMLIYSPYVKQKDTSKITAAGNIIFLNG